MKIAAILFISILVIGAIGSLIKGSDGTDGKTTAAATPGFVAVTLVPPNLVSNVLANPGLCNINVAAALGISSDAADRAKGHAISAACAAVDTHTMTGRWPTGYAP